MTEDPKSRADVESQAIRKRKVLIIDDETSFIERMSSYLSDRFELHAALSGREGLEKVREVLPDVVLLDYKLNDVYDGLDVLKEIKAHFAYINVILVSSFLDEKVVAEAEKLGVDECLPKNLNLGAFDRLILRAIERNLLSRKSQLAARGRARQAIEPVFDSPAMREVRARAQSYRNLDENILISGPPGAGKEVLASWIHQTSDRAGGPFCIVDLPSLSPTLFEAELFGQDKYSVADTQVTKRGLLELAHGGTIVLDEVGDLALAAQTKLLRAVEKKSFHRLGNDRMIAVDVRFITLTSKDLQAMVRAGTFKSELYYRMNTLRIDVPPLVERREDVPLLARQMLKTFGAAFRKDVRGTDPAVERRLLEYQWPGNVRELECVMKSAIIRAAGPAITLDDVTPSLGGPLSTGWGEPGATKLRFTEGRTMWERYYIKHLLETTSGDVKEAAKLAGIPRESLYRLLRKLKIMPGEFRR